MNTRYIHGRVTAKVRMGAILAVAVCQLFGLARASGQGVFISSAGLRLDNQPGWLYYQGEDARDGAYLAANGTWTQQITADVILGQTVPIGEYKLFLKVIDYDCKSRVNATLGDTSVSAVLNDRDSDGAWTDLGSLRLTNATGNLRLVFTNTLPNSIPARLLFRALYLAPSAENATVTAADQVMNIRYPSAEDYDDSAAVKGNVLGNSSFEAGIGGGWSLVWLRKNWTKGTLWDSAVGYHGRASLRFASQPSPPQSFLSLPIRLKPNKRYTLSAYVRCSVGRQQATLSLVNSLNAPVGMPAPPVYSTGKLLSPSEGWQRIVLSDRILAYPGDQFHIALSSQEYTAAEGGGSVWFDAVQLEEGDVTSFEPRDVVDLGVVLPRADSVLHPNETQGELLVANHSSAASVGSVKFEIHDHLLRPVKQGTIPVSIGAKSTKSIVLPLDVQKLGSFRGVVWTEDLPGGEVEFLYSVVPVPFTTGLDESSIMGIHSDHTDWQLSMLQRAGIKWTQNLSPGAQFRWSIAEPTEGAFVWFDEEIKRPKAYGVSILGNIGEQAPSWAHRTYFTLSNLVGAFRQGEPVRTASGASGNITVVLDASSATGLALQLTNVQGSFVQGDSVTGQDSRATAVISSSIFPISLALDKWETFVGSLVSHYKADVRWWEIWNEPNQGSTEVPNAPFYAEMLKRSIRAAKTADPSAKIVGLGGLYRPDYGIEVISRLPSNWTDDIAAISAHLYPGSGLLVPLLTQATQFKGKPVWNTETGTWDWGGFVGVNANVLRAGIPLYAYKASERFYRSAVTSPALLTQNFLQSIGGGMGKYFYYDNRNSESSANSFDGHPTLLDYHEGLKPKGVAYAILGHLFDHSTGLGSVTTRDAKTEAYLFDRAGVPSVGVFGIDGAEREMDLSGLIGSGSIEVFDFMGNPVPSQDFKVRYGRLPAYVRGVGVSVAQMRLGFGQGEIHKLVDTEAPQLSITLAPHRPVIVGDELSIRWLALDNVSLPDQAQPEALMYSWKLEGSDADWTPWSPKTFVSYSAVRSGRHAFSVKARDQAGNISAERTREIIGVLPRPQNLKISR